MVRATTILEASFTSRRMACRLLPFLSP